MKSQRRASLMVLALIIIGAVLLIVSDWFRTLRDNRAPIESTKIMETLVGPTVGTEPAPLAATVPTRTAIAVEWLVRVIDTASRPIVGAAIYQKSESSHVELGTTDSGGILRSVSLHSGDSIVASHPQFVSKSIVLPKSGDSSCVVQLEDAGEILGHVVFKDTGVANVWVVAIPTNLCRTVDARLAERALAGDPEVPSTRSGPDGRFTIRGLDPRVKFTLLAGGAGYGLPTWVHNISASRSSDEVTLPVFPLYGTALHFIGKDSVPLKIGQDVFSMGSRALSWPSDEKNISFTDVGPSAVLAGVPIKLALNPPSDWKVVIVGKEVDVASCGPLRLTTGFAGYEAISLSLDLPRIRDELSTREVVVQQATSGFATVTIELLDIPAIELPADVRGKFKLVSNLEFRNNQGEPFDYVIRNPQDRIVKINCVPYGNYSISYSSANGFHHSAQKTVSISHPDESFVLSATPIDPEDIGSLWVRVTRADGTNYDDRLMIGLRGGRDDSSANVVFDSPPYLLPMLPAKKLKLVIVADFPRDKGLPEYIYRDIEISSKKQLTLDLELKKY